MLDTNLIQSAPQSKEASSQNMRKQTNDPIKEKGGQEFQTEYEATASRNKVKESPDSETSKVEEADAAPAEEDDINLDDEILDDADIDFVLADVEAKDEETEANQPLIGMGEAKKAQDPLASTSKTATAAEPQVIREVRAQSQVLPQADPTSQRMMEGKTTTQNGTTIQPKKVENLNKSTAETIVMTKAAEHAAMAATLNVVKGDARADRINAQPAVTVLQSGQAQSLPAGSTAGKEVNSVLPESVRSKNLDEALPRSVEIRERTPPQPTTAQPTSFVPTPPAAPMQTLAKLEATKDKVELIPVGLSDLESIGSWETRPTGQAQATTLAQTLNRADTPAMISRQMAEAMQRLPDKPVEISLNPQELGRVRMSISAAEAGITVSVIAERPETLDLMRRNIDQLMRDFQSIGYENINFSFSEGQTKQNFGDDGEETSGGRHSSLELAPDDNIETPRGTPIASSGVDIRI